MRTRRLKTRTHPRRGATLVEAALVTVALLSLLLGTLDLGIAVLRYNMLSEAARTGARMAIVHGADAPSEMAAWNAATAATQIKTALEPLMAGSGVAAGDFIVTVTYEQSGGADAVKPGRPVTVLVSHNWLPIVTFLFGNAAVPLSATSKMIIAN